MSGQGYLTASEITSLRFYCGYPAYGAMPWQPLSVQGDAQKFDQIVGTIANEVVTPGVLTTEQIAILRDDYLVNLPLLLADITGARANLDTAKADVWEHNANELSDRTSLLSQRRRDLCYFLGVPIGDGIVPLVPAVFVV